MFVVKYDLQDMPANHQTFLRQRTFSVPVNRDKGTNLENNIKTQERTLRYLIHLRYFPLFTLYIFEKCYCVLLITLIGRGGNPSYNLFKALCREHAAGHWKRNTVLCF